MGLKIILEKPIANPIDLVFQEIDVDAIKQQLNIAEFKTMYKNTKYRLDITGELNTKSSQNMSIKMHKETLHFVCTTKYR